MQFKPELIEKIRKGEKSQTRRPFKLSDTWNIEDGHIMAVYRHNRPMWRVGQTYAICPGRGKPQVARLKLLKIRCEDVREISDEDVWAEGFKAKRDFMRVWCGFYDKAVTPPIIPDYNIGVVIWIGMKAELANRPDHLYQAWALNFELVKP